MVLTLKDGEQITIVTPQGVVVVGAGTETKSTLVTVGYGDGCALKHEVGLNENDGQEDHFVWIEPVELEEEGGTGEYAEDEWVCYS